MIFNIDRPQQRKRLTNFAITCVHVRRKVSCPSLDFKIWYFPIILK